MSSTIRLVLWGAAIWAVPFLLGMAIFAFVPTDSALFDTLMTLALGLAACVGSTAYLAKAPSPGMSAGVRAGLAWMFIALVLDAPFFLFGPQQMRMPVADYAGDIGLGYLLIPIIAGSIGSALQRARPS